MDPELWLRACQTIADCLQWQNDHPAESEAIGFQFREASETALTVTAKGMLFQLLLPTVPPEPDEIFIAMSSDNSAPNSLLVTLNEKLERVSIRPGALDKGLTVFAKVLANFEGKRKRASTTETVRLAGFEEDCFRQDSDGDLDMDDGLEERMRKGFLFTLTKEAGDRCKEARRRNMESVSPLTPIEPSFSGPTATTYMDDILQFCNVQTVYSLNQVRLQVEVPGFVNDTKMASSLGFSFSKSLQILLKFDEVFWGEKGSRRPLTLKRVAVGLGLVKDYDTEPLGEGSDGEFEEECKKYAGRQKPVGYGTSVLLPELVNTFFQHRCGEPAARLRAKPWENAYLDQALQHFAAIDNPFVGLICFLGSQLRSLPSWCAVCWSLLPASVWRLRTCQDNLCLYDFEELGLGAAIHHEIQESPEVVEFELSLACAAASSARDVFEPFPQAFLLEKELRERNGWFGKPASHKMSGLETRSKMATHLNRLISTGVATSQTVSQTVSTVDLQQLARDPGDLTGPGEEVSSKLKVAVKEMENKELKFLLETLQSIPSLTELQQSTDENSLKRKLSKVVFSAWRKKDPLARSEKCKMWLAYDLMRFIMSTNRLSLRVMKGEDELELGFKMRFQFAVLHDSPEKEAIFEARKASRGSFFAFHGSPDCNWYSILRNGLRSMTDTKFMSSGGAYGRGIYLSGSFGLSCGYARGHRNGSWKNGSLKDGAAVVAICEVVNLPPNPSSPLIGDPRQARKRSIFVVPDGYEDVSLRYLLVMDSACDPAAGASISINGCIMNGCKEPTDLRDKYERLKQQDQAQQQKQLLDLRQEAFLRVIADVISPEMEAECVDNKLPTPTITEPGFRSFSESEAESSPSPPSAHADELAARQSHSGPMPIPKKLKEKSSADTRAPLTAAATQAITKEFRNIQNEIRKAKRACNSNGPCTEAFLANVTVDMPDETNLCVWNVSLSQNLFKSYGKLYKDLRELAALNKEPECSVLLEVTFPVMFPFEPPFVRVVRPRFVFHTGHVTVGGSICMELLTSAGWLPSFSFESILVQIVNALVQGEGRIDMRAVGRDYSKLEAQVAFTRVAAQHGWAVPSGQP